MKIFFLEQHRIPKVKKRNNNLDNEQSPNGFMSSVWCCFMFLENFKETSKKIIIEFYFIFVLLFYLCVSVCR